MPQGLAAMVRERQWLFRMTRTFWISFVQRLGKVLQHGGPTVSAFDDSLLSMFCRRSLLGGCPACSVHMCHLCSASSMGIVWHRLIICYPAARFWRSNFHVEDVVHFSPSSQKGQGFCCIQCDRSAFNWDEQTNSCLSHVFTGCFFSFTRYHGYSNLMLLYNITIVSFFNFSKVSPFFWSKTKKVLHLLRAKMAAREAGLLPWHLLGLQGQPAERRWGRGQPT